MTRGFRLLIGLIVAAASHLALAQDTSFNRQGLERIEVPGNKCTGFVNTPSWRCVPITIPVYLRRASDGRALVAISHGSQGLDARHSMYAEQLAKSGINAAVVGHWEARGLSKIQFDYDKARREGGDSPNMVLDVLAVLANLQARPEFSGAKVGHMGESMGGTTAMNLTRPYLRRIYNELYGKPAPQLGALVALYSGCTERNTIEGFAPFPLLFVMGADDDNALASDCERQVPWMNGRGGKAQISVIPNQVHDFDAPYRWQRFQVENPAKCANLRDGETFTLEINGAKYPATTEGYAEMRRDCIRMTRSGTMSGNKGDPKTGYELWTAFLVKLLLH